MNRLRALSLLLSLSALLRVQNAAAEDFSPISATALPASNCSQASIELVAQASGIVHEAYRVTTSDDLFDFSSPVLAASQSSITGAVTRAIPLPAKASDDSLIGVAYTIGGSDLKNDNSAHFFVVYSCSHATTVYSCAGNGKNCPGSMHEYLPHIKRASYSSRGRFGVLADRAAHDQYLTFCNQGFVSTTIDSLTIEGRDAKAFSIESSDTLPLQLSGGSCSSARLRFRSRRVADFSAAFRVHPANPKVEDFVLPLSASTRHLPDLAVDVKDVKLGKVSGKDAILGVAVVKNNGLAPSQKGAVVTVKIAGYYSEDKSLPVTLLETALPSMKPGEKVILRYASAKHNFAGPINKQISAKIAGTKRQRGLDSSATGFTDYEYFGYSPNN